MSAKIPEAKPFPAGNDSSFKYTPLRQVRVLFVKFVQGLFYYSPRGAYHWDPDEAQSEIVITAESRIDPKTINKRPAITFTRGPVQYYGLGIDDLLSYELDIEKRTRAALIPGTMTINCISRVMLESEGIAGVVAEHIWLLRDLLMRAGFYDIGRSPSIGSPTQAGSVVMNDSGDEFTVTPVSVPFQFPRTSAVTPLAKKIVQAINQTISTETKTASSDGWAFSDHEFPVNVHECPPDSFAPQATDTYARTPDPAGTRQVFLSKQPHPLNPAVTVKVRTVRSSAKPIRLPASSDAVPIPDPCVKES